jgi:hypothetical protein
MPYVGRSTDKISNVEVLDNITFDGSSSYTLQKNSVNFTPSSANTLLVSIDGVVQAGNFTVSGSTIDFGTAVAGTSTCDFILHYGVGLITAPADGTVTTAKLGDSAVTTAKILDANVTLAKLASGVLPTNTPAFFATQTTAQSIANNTAVTLNFGTEAYDTDSALTTTTFTVPADKAGIYYFYAGFRLNTAVAASRLAIFIKVGATTISAGNFRQEDENSAFTSASANLSVGDAVTVQAFQTTGGSKDTTNLEYTFFGGYKIIE